MSVRQRVLATVAAIGAAAAAPIATYSVADRIAGPDGGWDLAAVDPGAHRLYVARTNALMAVDLTTNAVTASLTPLKFGHGVAVVSGANRVVATNGSSGVATLIEGDTGKVIAELPAGKNPDAAAYDPATRTVWVFSPGSHDATVIDPFAAKVVDTVFIGGALELAAADGEGRLYVNVEDKNEVVAIDTRARKVLAHYPLAGCDRPTGIAYAVKAKLILSACGDNVAKLIAPDGRDVATLKIGPHPDGAAIDERRQVALIPTGGDGKLSVIRLGAKPEVIDTLDTATGARTIALDPRTGTAYLPSAKYGPLAAGTRRPPILPGSFAVLVVKPTAAP